MENFEKYTVNENATIYDCLVKFELNNVTLERVPGKKVDKSLSTRFNYFNIPSYEEMISEMRNYLIKNE